ncbi:hypothetical protein KIPB_011376, partial [Kipferlia bialata]
ELSVPVPLSVDGAATATSIVSSSVKSLGTEPLVLASDDMSLTLRSVGIVASGSLYVGDSLTVMDSLSVDTIDAQSGDTVTVDDNLTVTGDITLESDVISASDFDVKVGSKTYTIGESQLSVPVPLSVTGDTSLAGDVKLSAGHNLEIGGKSVVSVSSSTTRIGSGTTRVDVPGSLSAGDIQDTPIGGTTPAAGTFSSLALDGGYVLPPTDGTLGQVLTTDGAGNASWGLPPAPTVIAAAAEALTAGDPVVMNSLGSLSLVTSYSAGLGDMSALGRDVGNEHVDMAEDADGNIIVVYTDTSNYGAYARLVATVGSSVLFGPEYEFAPITDEVYFPVITYDPTNDCFVIVYLVKNTTTSARTGHAVVARLNANSLSFGVVSDTIANIKGINALPRIHTVNHASASAMMLVYSDTMSVTYGRTLSVDNTDTIVFGTDIEVFPATTTPGPRIAYDSVLDASLVVQWGQVAVIKVTVGVVSVGTYVQIPSAVEIDVAFDPISHKAVIVYSGATETHACVATITGDTVSVGTSSVVTTQTVGTVSITYDESQQAFMIVTLDNDTAMHGTMWVARIEADDTVSFGSPMHYTDTYQPTRVGVYYSRSSDCTMVLSSLSEIRMYSKNTRVTLSDGTFIGLVNDDTAAGDMAVVGDGRVDTGVVASMTAGDVHMSTGDATASISLETGSATMSADTDLSLVVGTTEIVTATDGVTVSGPLSTSSTLAVTSTATLSGNVYASLNAYVTGKVFTNTIQARTGSTVTINDKLTVAGDLTLESDIVSASGFRIYAGAKSYTIGETELSVPVPLSVDGAATATS